MNERTSTNSLSETNKHNLRIKVLLDKLKSKLKDFLVLDSLGNLVGKVKSVHLDSARQLNLVISEEDMAGARPFLLRSNHIHQVDYTTRAVVLDISKAEIQQLPQYKRSQTTTTDLSSRQTRDFTQESVAELNSYTEQMSVPAEGNNNLELSESSELPEEIEEEVIRLLEERLIVNLNKRKVGEVVVRKEIETRMVEVPVQYEKLIVEQVSPEPKTLAEIDLSAPEIPTLQATETVVAESQPTVGGEFSSPKTASLLLDAIARQRNHGCKRIRIEIVLEDRENQEIYQDWFNRCAGT